MNFGIYDPLNQQKTTSINSSVSLKSALCHEAPRNTFIKGSFLFGWFLIVTGILENLDIWLRNKILDYFAFSSFLLSWSSEFRNVKKFFPAYIVVNNTHFMWLDWRTNKTEIIWRYNCLQISGFTIVSSVSSQSTFQLSYLCYTYGTQP